MINFYLKIQFLVPFQKTFFHYLSTYQIQKPGQDNKWYTTATDMSEKLVSVTTNIFLAVA